jgi:hypothetical protein
LVACNQSCGREEFSVESLLRRVLVGIVKRNTTIHHKVDPAGFGKKARDSDIRFTEDILASTTA